MSNEPIYQASPPKLVDEKENAKGLVNRKFDLTDKELDEEIAKHHFRNAWATTVRTIRPPNMKSVMLIAKMGCGAVKY